MFFCVFFQEFHNQKGESHNFFFVKIKVIILTLMYLGMTALDLAQDMPMRDSSGSSVAEVLRENGKPLLNFLHFIQAFNFGALHACTF